MCDLCRSDPGYEPIPDPLVRDDGVSSMRMLALVIWYVLAMVALIVAYIGFLASPALADDFDEAARIAYDNTRVYKSSDLTTDGVADCTDGARAALLFLSDRGHRPGRAFCAVGGVIHVFLVLEDGRAIDVNHKRPVPLHEIGCDRQPLVTPWFPAMVRKAKKAGS